MSQYSLWPDIIFHYQYMTEKHQSNEKGKAQKKTIPYSIDVTRTTHANYKRKR